MMILTFFLLGLFFPSVLLTGFITLPFKRVKNDNFSSKADIANSLSKNPLVVQFDLGNPSQRLNIALKSKNSQVYIVSSTAESQFKMKGFDETLSQTEIDKYETYDLLNEFDKGFFANDIITYNKDFYKLYFYLVKEMNTGSTLGDFDGNLGLSLESVWMNFLPYECNLVKDLKSDEITSKLVFVINYTSHDEGNLIIGDYFENVEKKYFNTTSRDVKAIISERVLQWGFKADTVSVGGEKIKDVTSVKLDFEENCFVTTPAMNRSLYNKFFKQYLENDQCEIVKTYGKRYYVCNKSGVDITKFPEISLTINEINTVFNFTYQDLFVEKGDSLYCMVSFYDFTTSDSIIWVIGSILLRKYPTFFDMDKKMNGFYFGDKKEVEPDPIDPKPVVIKKKSPELIIALVLVSIFAVTVIFFSYRYIRKLRGRKKRATELDDEGYDYQELKKTNPQYYIEATS